MQQSTSKAQWEWKSNPNPFSDSEEPQWTNYSQFDNEKLEQAYQSQNQQKEVDLGNYIISIQDMLQRKKDNLFKQRPIRRNIALLKEDEVDQEAEIREKRFFGAETPKTFNKAFGSLQDYLKFFENRGQEIRGFANLFNEIEAQNNLDLLNSKILPCIVDSISTESMKMPNNKEEKKLLLLFQQNFLRMEQFYAHVLRAYTIESFLYKNMNFYLRNEDWIQLHPLLPYAYCLCKAFFCSELVSNLHKIKVQPADQNEEQRIILYRGAAFNETTLSFYDKNNIENFCWNAVTSTSRRRDIAQKFMDMNQDSNKPIPVLFIIEIPLRNFEKEKAINWIDIQQYSAAPQEDEVVLPPGSVFELTGVSRDELGAEIRLRLVVDVEKLAHQGQIMHGAMLSEMAQKTSSKVVCLEGRELLEAIVHLKGNQVIEELEFCLCKFDEKVGVCLAETLEKIPSIKKLIFTSPLGVNQSHWSVILKSLKKVCPEGLEIADDVDSHQLDLIAKGIRNLTSLTSLTLNFNSSEKITDENLNNLSSQALKHLTLLRSLVLDFGSCDQITDEGLKSLCFEVLKLATPLTSLALHFPNCSQISDEGLKILSLHGIQHLTLLVSLVIDFSFCKKITDEGLNYLSSKGIEHLTSLTSLTLNFNFCNKISDEGLNSLWSQGAMHLVLLTSLSLHFQSCSGVSDQGLNDLSCQGLKNLTSLRSLTLSFRYCDQITDEGLYDLLYEGIRHLTSLESLTLNFERCSGMTDDGLDYLCQKGIKPLTSLLSLALYFDFCPQISSYGSQDLQELLKSYNSTPIKNDGIDESMTFFRKLEGGKVASPKDLFGERAIPFGSTIILNTGEKLESFVENPLTEDSKKDRTIDGRRLSTMEEISWFVMEIAPYTTSIVSLTLDLSWSEITDEGLQNLCCQGLQHLISLTSLSLNLTQCSYITNDGLNILCTEGLRYLTSLRSLTLDFTYCYQITDEYLYILSSQGLQFLTSLKSLILNLSAFSEIGMQITDEGLDNLISPAFKFLTSLHSLALYFHYWDITDEGLNFLVSQELRHLVSLRSLVLDFSFCFKITDKGLSSLSSQALKHLTPLTSLTLDFSQCEVTDVGVRSLCHEGIKYLTNLSSLALGFSECKVTNIGVSYLCREGIKYLTDLTSLTLDFWKCEEVTDVCVSSLCHEGLKYLTNLKSLTLDFSGCKGITDEALGDLCCQGLSHLKSLLSFNLNLSYCPQITSEGLNTLCSKGIKSLTSLALLSLKISDCPKVKDMAWRNFHKVLKYFGYLPSKQDTFNPYKHSFYIH